MKLWSFSTWCVCMFCSCFILTLVWIFLKYRYSYSWNNQYTLDSRRDHVQPYARLGEQVRATLRKSWRNIYLLLLQAPSPSAWRSIHENKGWRASFSCVNRVYKSYMIPRLYSEHVYDLRGAADLCASVSGRHRHWVRQEETERLPSHHAQPVRVSIPDGGPRHDATVDTGDTTEHGRRGQHGDDGGPGTVLPSMSVIWH